VAVFNASKAQRSFHLLSQRTSKAFHLPEDHTQSIDEGVLGKVYRTKKPVNIGNVKDETYRDVYKSTIAQTRSELCIPIESGELFWLLNIEDSREDAFSKDEELDLMRRIKEVIVFLERSWLRKVLDNSLLSTSDAVWVTDNQGQITRANPAAQALLGYSESEFMERGLADIIRDPEVAKRLVDKKKEPNMKIGLRAKDGGFINVLLSKFRLQEYFATNVYIAKDLSVQERLEELEYLGKMYFEIATQTQTPLMLIFGWLERLCRQSDDESTKAVVDRSLRQLRKIELTYDRLSFYDKEKISESDFPHHKILCSLEEIWRIVEDDFPQNELDRIKIDLECEGPLIEGDLFQLSFCFETILSYLMRFLPQDQKVYVHVNTTADQLRVNIKSRLPGLKSNSDHAGTLSRIERTLVEMGLGEKILREFIVEKHGGSYSRTTWPEDQEDEVEFFITIPLAEDGLK
jgi:PAS domain S-box-containing protein